MITCPSCGAGYPEHANFCMDCGTALGPPRENVEERKVVTSLFCDLVDFTAASEKSDPEDVDRVLRQYNAIARRVIETHGGTVEKFIGDAVVAVFGVPVVHEDDAERAVRVALRLVEVSECLAGIGGDSLRLRVGVNTGEALVRLDVAPGSGEGFLTGDAVNVAARLQAAAPPMGILVGKSTHDLTAARFEYESLDPIVVKGKSEPLAAWLAKAAVSRTGLQGDHARLTPFIGRESELALLRALFHEAVAAKSPQYALLVGDPGIGKSRLVAELLAYVDGLPDLITWRQGRCLPYGDGVTFSALSEIVKAHAGVLDTDDPGTASARLAMTTPDCADREWLRMRLGALIGLDAPDATRNENFAAWSTFFEALAGDRALVLVFEDLHWAEEALLAFIDHLATHVHAVPLLVIATIRPDLLHARAELPSALGRFAPITLEPLTREDTERLAAVLLRDVPRSAGLVATVARRAEGNPFYVEESVRLVSEQVETGLAVIDGKSPSRELDDFCILPGSVQAILAARLDALPMDLKAVLADAAVVGASFWSGAITSLGQRSIDVVDAALEELLRRQLVRAVRRSTMANEREFTFWHALARDVAYRQLPRASRLKKHAAVAAWLEAKAGDLAVDHAETIGHHYATAHDLAIVLGDEGQADRLRYVAGHYLGLAGTRTMRLDLTAAQVQLSRALELLPLGLERARVAYRMARALVSVGALERGMTAYREAAHALREAGDSNAAAACLIDLSMWQASTGDARWRAAYEKAVRLYDFDRPTPDLVHALQESAAELTLRFFDAAGAERAADRALEVAERLGLRPPPAAFEWRSEARAALGDDRWLEDFERAIAAGEAQGGGDDMCRLYHNRSHILESTRGPAAAVEALRENMDFAHRLGSQYFVLTAQCGILCGQFASGEWDEAAAEAERLIALASELGWDEEAGVVRSVRAMLLVARGERLDTRESEPLLRHLVVMGQPGAADHLLVATCAVLAAHMQTARGKIGEALMLLERCVDERHLGPWGAACEGYRFGIGPWAISLALRLGELTLADRLAAQATTLTPADRVAGIVARSLVDEVLGEFGSAAAGFADAAARWHEFGVPYEEGQALIGRGRCLLALGRAPEAAAPLAAAREIFARLGARPALVETDNWLARTKSM